LPSGKAILSIFNPLVRRDAVGQLVKNKNTAFSLDIIPRTTRAQAMDVLSSQATVGGYKAVLEAASLLPRFFPMFMTAAGTIRPSKVLILGAGVAGLQAIATARKLGAVVEVFDVRAAVKEEVKSLGGKFIEVEGAKDEASAGGYAVEQTEDFKKRQQELIQDHSIKANVIITTAQIPGKTAPLLIPKSTVEKMQAGSVIIDMAASSGGNCEVTKAGETVEHKGVRVLGKTNYPAEMPVDASRMLGNNYLNFIEIITGDAHELKVDMEDNLVKGTCIAHQGEIISERLKS
jgi:NAD(P) transhydrogenase subunit alpha